MVQWVNYGLIPFAVLGTALLIVFLFAALLPRSLSTDTKINLIIGVLTIATGILSILLAWAMWKLAREGRQRRAHQSQLFHCRAN